MLLAWSLNHRGERAEALAILRWGRGRYPTDFWLHYSLGTMLGEDRTPAPVDVEERIGCYRAALALRPDATAVHHDLGLALAAKKQWGDAITEFKKAVDLYPKNASFHDTLGNALADNKQLDDAIAEYNKAIKLDPKHARAHYNLGRALYSKNQLDDAIAEYNKAIKLDPNFALAHNGLGVALAAKNQLDEAIAEFKQAIDLDPKYALTHYNLGNALKAKNQLDGAIAEYKKAIDLDPKHVLAHNNLGSVLASKKQLDDAIAEYNKAIDLDPKHALAYYNIGNALYAKGQWDDAIAEFNKAIELDPKYAQAHNNLGLALKAKGQLDEAGAAYRKAIEAQPTLAEAHCNLGFVLRNQGRFADSLASFRCGHELGSKRTDWRFPSAAWVRHADWLAALEKKLPKLQAGEYKPQDTDERLGLAEVCRVKQLHRAAVGLYTDAFTAAPELAGDLLASHRYNAVCCAALAAAGQGLDADKLDDQECTRLRQQALNWLCADLNLWSKRLEDGKPEDRQAIRTTLQRWQRDPDLATVRSAEALKKLSAEEQESWRKLWANVTDLLQKSAGAK
jgi:tetratricopeptide (TPR) repeat protein